MVGMATHRSAPAWPADMLPRGVRDKLLRLAERVKAKHAAQQEAEEAAAAAAASEQGSGALHEVKSWLHLAGSGGNT